MVWISNSFGVLREPENHSSRSTAISDSRTCFYVKCSQHRHCIKTAKIIFFFFINYYETQNVKQQQVIKTRTGKLAVMINLLKWYVFKPFKNNTRSDSDRNNTRFFVNESSRSTRSAISRVRKRTLWRCMYCCRRCRRVVRGSRTWSA